MLKEEKRKIPTLPRSVKTPSGRNTWKRAWVSETVDEKDYDAILLLSLLVDERSIMTQFLEDNPHKRVLEINNNTNTILHPYIKRIEAVDKQIESLLGNLGLTPMARTKMGYTPEGAEENPLVTLVNKWNKEM